MAQTTPYGIPMVQATDATFPGADQSNVTVCIIDSGYHEAHEDLQATSGVTGTNVSRHRATGTRTPAATARTWPAPSPRWTTRRASSASAATARSACTS